MHPWFGKALFLAGLVAVVVIRAPQEKHKLVTHGVYRHIRHPMYAAILLQAAAQALLLPNWVAGPASGLVFLPMFALRLGPEERMMLDAFAGDYAVYLRRTKRLIPSVW